MAAESPSITRGLVVPHPRVTAANLTPSSTYDQAGPRPGVPAPQQDTSLVLQSSGTQAANTALRIRSLSSGMAAGDAARFAWKYSADTNWRGWNTPSVPKWQVVAQASTGSLRGVRWPHAVTTDDGTVVVAYCSNDGSTSIVRCYRRNPSTGSWGTAISVHSETATSFELHPTLVKEPDGRLVLYLLTFDTATGLAQVRTYRSADDGATWSDGSPWVLPSALSTATYIGFRGMRAATNGDETLLVLSVTKTGPTDAELQYASAQGGEAFDLVDEDTSVGFSPDVVAFPSGGFLYFNGQSRFLSSAYDALSGLTAPGALTGHAPDGDGQCALCVADDGKVYALSVDVGDDRAGVSYTEDGTSWNLMGSTASSTGYWYRALSSTQNPRRICATWQRGRVVLLHNWASSATTYDNSLAAYYLGGYSTLEVPPLEPFSRITNQMSPAWMYVAMGLPGATGLTATGTAASEGIDANGDLATTTTTGNARYYTAPIAPSNPDHMTVVLFTGSCTTGQMQVQVSATDSSSKDWDFSVILSSTGITLYDNNGAAAITGSASVAAGTTVQILIAVQGLALSVWYREFDASADEEWTSVCSAQALSNGAGSGTDLLRFGRISTAGASEFTARSIVLFSSSTAPGVLATGFSNPGNLRGRPYSFLPVDIDGTRISARGGVTSTGDTFHVDTAYDYGVEHLSVRDSRSPRRVWRSKTTTAGMTFEWQLDDYDTALDHEVWGLWLDNINFATADIETSDTASPSYSSPTSLDFRVQVAYERKGSKVVPKTTGTASAGIYLHRNELAPGPGGRAGGWFQFSSGEVRPILSNGGGNWSIGSTVAERRAHIICDDIDDGESDGTGYIWFPRALVLFHRFSGGNGIATVRLRLRPSGGDPAPVNGYFQGKLLLGPYHPFGRSYGFGRRVLHLSNVAVDELPSGTERVRQLGPRVRSWAMRWDDALLTNQTRGSEVADYLLTTSTSGQQPVANARDVQWFLEGLHEELGGPLTPVLLVPYAPSGAPDTVTHLAQRARGAALASFPPEFALESYRGTEELSEVLRTGLVLKEVL